MHIMFSFVTFLLLSCVGSVHAYTNSIITDSFNQPHGVYVDSSNHIWVADTTNGLIKVLNSGGTEIAQYGGFSAPMDVKVLANGDFLVSDYTLQSVQLIHPTSSSSYTTLFTYNTVSSGVTSLGNVLYMDLDASGNIYVTDLSNSRLVRFASGVNNGVQFLTLVNTPIGVHVTATEVFVTSATGVKSYGLGCSLPCESPTLEISASTPEDVVVDSVDGSIYITDNANNRVVQYDGTGTLVTSYTVSQATPYHPLGIALDAQGNIITADQNTPQLVIFNQVAAISGDPQFQGLQGQEFQVHGTPGEYFNLISSPHFQLNSRFVFLNQQAVGYHSCTYNNTACWSHDGTYLDIIGMMWPGLRITLTAGPHKHGMKMEVNGVRQSPQEEEVIFYTNTTTASSRVTISFPSHEAVSITFSTFHMTFVNSHKFFNLQVTCRQHDVLRAGKQHHDFKGEYDMPDELYPNIPLHGLLGQTWRAARYGPAHHPFQGAIDDYMAPDQDLFSTHFMFNQYLTNDN